MNPPLTFRAATAADTALLRHWDAQEHIIASDPNSDWEWESELLRSPPWREQLIAMLGDEAIGFVQIIDPAEEDSHYWGEDTPANQRAVDIWIGEARYLGMGYGTRMMQMALARCFADAAVTDVLIDPLAANARAIRFYERCGFEFLERRWFGADDCAVMILRRARWAAAASVVDDASAPGV